MKFLYFINYFNFETFTEYSVNSINNKSSFFKFGMNIKSIFINPPVKNIQKTREFSTNLGFSFNEQFSDDIALCLVLNDGLIYAMLIKHQMFSTFTNRPISYGLTTQVLTSIQVESKEEVGRIIKFVFENGATHFRKVPTMAGCITIVLQT